MPSKAVDARTRIQEWNTSSVLPNHGSNSLTGRPGMRKKCCRYMGINYFLFLSVDTDSSVAGPGYLTTPKAFLMAQLLIPH